MQTKAHPSLNKHLPVSTSTSELKSIYARIIEISQQVTGGPAAFSGLVATEPVQLSTTAWNETVKRNGLLRAWQQTCLDLFAASVAKDFSPAVASAVLDHLPAHVGWDHHLRLPLSKIHTPVFFRTDQAADGTVLEVQCPGSLWGVHEILREFYAESGFESAASATSLSSGFLKSIQRRLAEPPVIHHLLDNSSHPAGERFFIQRARCGARYFGFDNVRPQECNFVRSHDFPTLLVENFAAERIHRLVEGSSVYDLPPIALFDQKLLLSFPFADETRDYFSDEMREMFPHTSVLTDRGLRLPSGEWVTVKQFADLPRSARSYFLKYAGSDVSRNWGSRAVFHLGKMSGATCEATLKKALELFDRGERWIIQKETGRREDISFYSRERQVVMSSGTHSKHSVFYGPDGPLGMLNMFEQFYKVHGSTETITAIAVAPGASNGARMP
jgi:hypothetical protein